MTNVREAVAQILGESGKAFPNWKALAGEVSKVRGKETDEVAVSYHAIREVKEGVVVFKVGQKYCLTCGRLKNRCLGHKSKILNTTKDEGNIPLTPVKETVEEIASEEMSEENLEAIANS